MEQVVITHLDGSTLKLQSKANNSTITKATQSVELLGNDIVDITVESANKLNFYIGDKITIIGRDYTLNTPAKERKISEAHFIYDLQFEGVQYDLLRATYSVNVDTTSNQIQDLNGESLTGDLKRFLDVLISNANRVFPGKWSLGTYPSGTETKTLTFGDSDTCLSALQSLCSDENYNTEFSISIDGSGNRTLNVGTVGIAHAYTFEYGKGKGIYELTREKSSSSNIITRLNVFGSSKNIMTSKYRAAKLCLPGKSKSQSCIESSSSIAKFGIWEYNKNFDNIYPSRVGTVSALGDTELKFIDSAMDFDLNEKEVDGVTTKYLIPGTSAKIHFNTGNLAGYEFELKAYDHATKQFTLLPLTDENGYRFPSATSSAFKFAAGDNYVILDIYLPQSYIDIAESKLQTAGQAFLDKYSQPRVQYGLTIDDFYLAKIGANPESNLIWAGDSIHVKDLDLEIDKSIRIKSFSRDLLRDSSYSITISDIAVSESTISRIISDINDFEKIIKVNNLNDPARARRNWLAAQEVLNMVFDSDGDYFSEKIKPLSIETNMLAVGAKSMQFGLMGTIFQPNYLGAKNRVVYTGGVLTHYAILDASEEPRVWPLANGDTTLVTDGAHYVYAKCHKTNTSGFILFSPSKILADSDPDYFHFLVGVLNSVDSNNVRSLALMHGFTTINGRYIKTGRISDANEKFIIDLDNATITATEGATIEGLVTFKRLEGEINDNPELQGTFAGMIEAILDLQNASTRRYSAGVGGAKLISELAQSSGVSSSTKIEVENAETQNSLYIELSQLGAFLQQYYPSAWANVTGKPEWVSKLGWDAANNRVTISNDLHVVGNISASKDVIAYLAGEVTSDVLAGLTATAPLRKSSASNLVLDYNTSQFEVSGGILQIKAGVLAPSAHSHLISDVTGLQAALDSKMVVHTHPYRADSWVPSWSDVTGKPTLLDLGETSSTAYRGDRGKIAYDHSQVAHQSIINGTGLVRANGTTLSYDNNTYLTGNQSITLSGIITGTGTTAITTAIADNALSIAKTSGLQTALNAKMATASYPDLTAIEALAGTSGLLKKTAANTWTLDMNTYLTGITKAQVEAVLTGAITTHTHSYLPLAGGTLSGNLTLSGKDIDLQYAGYWGFIKNSLANGGLAFATGNASGVLVTGLRISATGNYVDSLLPLKENGNQVWHAGNLTNTLTSNYIPRWDGSRFINSNGKYLGSEPYVVFNTPSEGLPRNSGTSQTYGSMRLGSDASNGCLDLGYAGGGASWIQATNISNLSLTYNILLNPNGGSVFIGYAADPTSGNKLAVNGAAYVNGTGYFSSNLTCAAEITAYSDGRLKKIIRPTESVLDRVERLRVWDYTRTDNHTGKLRTGLIAQELRELFPQFVSGNEATGYLSVNYAEMVNVCLKAIQELKAEINNLKKVA